MSSKLLDSLSLTVFLEIVVPISLIWVCIGIVSCISNPHSIIEILRICSMGFVISVLTCILVLRIYYTRKAKSQFGVEG